MNPPEADFASIVTLTLHSPSSSELTTSRAAPGSLVHRPDPRSNHGEQLLGSESINAVCYPKERARSGFAAPRTVPAQGPVCAQSNTVPCVLRNCNAPLRLAAAAASIGKLKGCRDFPVVWATLSSVWYRAGSLRHCENLPNFSLDNFPPLNIMTLQHIAQAHPHPPLGEL
jgi:hypothetical protein